jgi:hypothetical protein
MRKSDRPIEALDAKGSSSESASVQTTMKIERRASLEKPNVPVEIVGASRRPKPGREESVTSIFQEDRGSGGGMRAKDRGVNTGDPAQCFGTSPSNRRSARIGAGLNWESERFVVAMKRVMIVERRDLSSRAASEVTRGKRLTARSSNVLRPRQVQTTFNGLSEDEAGIHRVRERCAPCPKAGCRRSARPV